MTTEIIETKTNLKPQTLSGLQELTQASIDSAKGFEEVASAVKDPALKTRSDSLAKQRYEHAAELNRLISGSGEQPKVDGSWLAVYHRTWIATKAALTSGDAASLLAEIIRGETYLSERYESVIKQTTGSAVSDVLHRHYATVVDSLKQAEQEKATLDS